MCHNVPMSQRPKLPALQRANVPSSQPPNVPIQIRFYNVLVSQCFRFAGFHPRNVEFFNFQIPHRIIIQMSSFLMSQFPNLTDTQCLIFESHSFPGFQCPGIRVSQCRNSSVFLFTNVPVSRFSSVPTPTNSEGNSFPVSKFPNVPAS